MTKFESAVRAEWPQEADTILGLIRGTIHPQTFPAVQLWLDQRHNEPSKHEQIACALDSTLGTYGVEAAFEGGAMWPYLEWLNAGDTYATTLVYHKGSWRVGCYGDYIRDDS